MCLYLYVFAVFCVMDDVSAGNGEQGQSSSALLTTDDQRQQQQTVKLCDELQLGLKTDELLPKVILDEL